MQMIIWKYTINSLKRNEILGLPRGAKILSVGVQSREIVVWAEVDPDAPRETRIALAMFTGEPFTVAASRPIDFIGTVSIGGLVYHIYIEQSEVSES